jgi:cytochrome c-type biogenesis protein CcmE
MKLRYKRIAIIAFMLALVSVALMLLWSAFNDNLLYSFSPTQINNREAPLGREFRLAGMVKDDSLKLLGGVEIEFIVTDFNNEITVRYSGLTPDLFGEGQGIVALGILQDGIFVTSENGLLAKHDENYMPPEVAAALGIS